MGRRGPKPTDLPAWRPQLRVRPDVLLRLRRLPLEDLAHLVEWALDHWPGRAGLAELTSAAARVTLRPSKPLLLDPAVLWHDAARGVLCAARPTRSDVFREQIRAQGFEWHETRARWERPLGPQQGRPEDRVCELAAQLYQAGWPVTVPSRDLADRIVTGRYDPEQTRWVDVSDGGRFLLTWEHGADAVWRATQAIPGARWDKTLQGTVVGGRAYESVLDFADEWGFALTDAAQQRLLSVQAEVERDLIGVELTVPVPTRRVARPSLHQGVIPNDLLADAN